MTMTPVFENDYQYSELIQRATDIPHTNGTTRTLKHRELVVVVHNTNQYFIGFVAEPGGIAAGATGRVDLAAGKEIATNQFAAGSYVDGDVGVYITPQTNSAAAIINQASAGGRVPLLAYIAGYDADETIRLRMPVQDGTATAA